MRIFIISVSFFLLYLFFITSVVNDPLNSDELTWPSSAQSLIQTGNAVDVLGGSATWSPPLYLNMQVFLDRIFGVSNISSRIIGIFCILLQLLLLCYFARIFFNGPSDQWKFVLLSSLIFITNPAVIKGSLTPDIDTTILSAFLTLFILLFIKFEKRINLATTVVLSIIFSICLWSKLTTPPIIIFAMLIYYSFNRNREGIVATIIVLILGFFLFLASWATYAKLKGLDASGPIRYAIGAFISKQVVVEIKSVFLGFSTTIIRFILWFGFYSFLLGAIALIARVLNFKRQKIWEPIDFLVIYIILLGIGYVIVGGASFGFPKYHYPIFPAIAILSAFMFKNLWDDVSVKDIVLYFCIAVLTSIYFYFFVRDPIYIFNFRIREMVVNGFGIKSILHLLLCRFTLYLLPGIVIFLFAKTHAKKYKLFGRLLLTLIVMILAANLSLDFIQSKAPYLTMYNYGEEGTEDLIAYLDSNLLSGDAVLATCDIVYYLRQRGKDIPYFRDDSWDKLDIVKKIINDPSVKFIVYSIGHNDIEQFKEVILNPVFLSELKDNFIFKQIGTYKVWKRKS